MEEYVTNVHLKDAIKDFKMYVETDEEAPDEVIIRLMCELKVSNLLIPGIDEGDSFAFEHVTIDDESFIPLFTDTEEFDKFSIDGEEFSPIAFDFDVYEDLVLENDLDGIVLNADGEAMTIGEEFIKAISQFEESEAEEAPDAYTAQKLKEMFENASNEALAELIRESDDNDDDLEKLFVELSDSTMLNIVINDESLDKFTNDGIISADDVDGFSLCTIETDDIRMGAIFTDKLSIEKAIDKDSGFFYYGQVTILSELFDYILRSDMDGVIINPNTDDYIILREDILPQATGVDIVLDDPNLEDALDYAFLL